MTPAGEEGYYSATTEPFDAIVLDLMLPGRDGLQVLKDLRAHGVAKPVLILTSRDTVEDRVTRLEKEMAEIRQGQVAGVFALKGFEGDHRFFRW